MIEYCRISRLVGSAWYTDCVYLPTWHDMHEIFTLSWPEFAETSRWLPKTFWRLQNIAENVCRCSEDVWALPKLLYKTTILACFDFVRAQKRIQSHHLTPFWIEFSLFIMCYRTLIYPDLWVRHEKLSLMCEIYSGPKVSRQFQFTHSNFNLFTAISIYSRQFRFAHSNCNSNFNLLTAISFFSLQCYSIFRFAHYLSTTAADSSYQTSIKTQNRKSIFKVDLLYCSQKIISFI